VRVWDSNVDRRMSTLSDVSQSNIGWVYPPQPQTVITTIEEVSGIVSGLIALVNGQDYIDVAFGTAQPTADWTPIEMSIDNLVDATPVNVWRGVITSKTTTGFRLQLNGTPDSDNYVLYWSIKGVFGYSFTGPITGDVGDASTNFTVSLPPESTLTGTVIITPSDAGDGGTFTPTTLSLTTASPSGTFTYTPASGGIKTLSVTNNRGLVNPPQILYTSVVPPPPSPHLLDTLISYWKLDEASGAARNDSHGTNHLAETAGSPGSFAAVINNGAYSNGAGGAPYLSKASNASLQVTGDFTFSLWVRLDDPAGNRVILSKNNAAVNAFDYIIGSGGTGAGFYIGAGNAGGAASQGATAGAAFSVHHIVAWFDSSDNKLRIRINDANTYVSPGTFTLIQGTDPIAVLAASYGNVNWNGLVDEIGFWKRKLTAQEITALYNGGAGLPYSSFTA